MVFVISKVKLNKKTNLMSLRQTIVDPLFFLRKKPSSQKIISYALVKMTEKMIDSGEFEKSLLTYFNLKENCRE